MTHKRDAPATARNREPILRVLAPLLADGSLVLEVASGTGQHAVYFATGLPRVTWQPTDGDPENLASIEAWRAEAASPNLRAPLLLDAASDTWPIDRADAVVCINMIHIAPWAACEGLIRGAARVLAPGGFLFLYGPYRVAGVLAPESNVAFDASLRGRNPAWGVRELDDVTALAASHGLVRDAVTSMPANNLSVVFRRQK
jgi:SAM-dependent methyltransferase